LGQFGTNDFNDKFFIAFLSTRKKIIAFYIHFVLGIISEFQTYPKQKLLKTVSSPPFFRREEKKGKN